MGDTVALNVQHLTKTYGTGPNALTVLNDVSFALATGSTCAVVGPSGSGKTTLLGLCAGLDRASSGSVALDGVDLDGLDEDQRAHLRSEKVGFVFQTFQLIPTLSALENAMVPLELRREPNVRERAVDLLDRVGLGDRLHHYPAQLSGGEQQRVALARAFINRPCTPLCRRTYRQPRRRHQRQSAGPTLQPQRRIRCHLNFGHPRSRRWPASPSESSASRAAGSPTIS